MTALVTTPVTLGIDIWSDVMCPWCVIGYKSLTRALEKLDGEITAEIRWRAFELNPDMAAEGEDLGSHMRRKYGQSPTAEATARMVDLAARAGYDMRYLGQEPEPERRHEGLILLTSLRRNLFPAAPAYEAAA